MIHLPTGETKIIEEDFRLNGVIPIIFKRNYDSWVSHLKSGMGLVWTHNYDQYIQIEEDDTLGTTLVWQKSNGSTIQLYGYKFEEPTIVQSEKIIYTHLSDKILIENYEEDLLYTFEQVCKSCDAYRLTKIERHRFRILLSYDEYGKLLEINDSAYRTLSFHRGNSGEIERIDLHCNEKVKTLATYSYDNASRMTSAMDAMGHSEHYEYHGELLSCKTDKNGNKQYWQYEDKKDNAKCIGRYYEGGFMCEKFEYHKKKTIVIDAMGGKSIYKFNSDDEVVEYTNALGQTERWTYDVYGLMRAHYLLIAQLLLLLPL